MKICHTRSGLFLLPDEIAERLIKADKAQIVEGLQASQVRYTRSFIALSDGEEEAARGYRKWSSLDEPKKEVVKDEDPDEEDEDVPVTTTPRRRRKYDRRDMEATEE